MPPFGKLFGLPVYCDSALAKPAEMEFNAGTHVDTIRMTYTGFVKLENPTVVSFAERTHGPACRSDGVIAGQHVCRSHRCRQKTR